MRPPEPARPTRAVGFDLGETLLTYADIPLNWASLYEPALRDVAAACGTTLTPQRFDAASQWLLQFNTRLHPRREEVAAEMIFARLLALWEIPTATALAPAISAFFRFFQQKLQAYPETLETLTTLRARGFSLGILTDVPYGMPRDFVVRDVREAGIENAVDLLLTSADVGRRKPDPAGFSCLATKLKSEVTTLWFVGNEEKDIVGARAAGATAVLIDREGKAPNWGQHHTLQDLRELIALL